MAPLQRTIEAREGEVENEKKVVTRNNVYHILVFSCIFFFDSCDLHFKWNVHSCNKPTCKLYMFLTPMLKKKKKHVVTMFLNPLVAPIVMARFLISPSMGIPMCGRVLRKWLSGPQVTILGAGNHPQMVVFGSFPHEFFRQLTFMFRDFPLHMIRNLSVGSSRLVMLWWSNLRRIDVQIEVCV